MSPAVHITSSAALTPDDRVALRRLLDAAFAGDFADEDWDHALGGWHALIVEAGEMVAHASVVERRLWIGDRTLSAGYVEAVAVTPSRQGQGLGTRVMSRVEDIIRERFDLGALSSGEWGFYERLGWQRWRGPSFVRALDGSLTRSAEEDEGIMVLPCPRGGAIDLAAPIVCDARSGDSW